MRFDNQTQNLKTVLQCVTDQNSNGRPDVSLLNGDGVHLGRRDWTVVGAGRGLLDGLDELSEAHRDKVVNAFSDLLVQKPSAHLVLLV